MHVTVDGVNFCDGLECVYVKYKIRASTARELPDKYMGFAGYNMAVNSVRQYYVLKSTNTSDLHDFNVI